MSAEEQLVNGTCRRIRIVVPGEPVAQGRPRFAKRGGFVTTYDPKKSRDYKQRIQDELTPLLWRNPPFTPIEGPVYLSLVVYRSVPKSWSRKKRVDALGDVILPTSRPDLDNYVKGVLDALNGLVMKDDSQITTLTARKYYSDNPRIEIEIVEQ